ncbi:hypothetical protein Tco_0655013 [Tanacetum coccineum]|uniref:Uncharacterized protein n=1 Tax=Tanacetum coccineum TaxID=301880 RepID=A0ABQ4X4T3_9ASTR
MVVAAPPNAPLSCDKPQTERTVVVRAVVVIGWCRGGCGCGVVVSWVKAAAVDGGDGEDGRLWLPEGGGVEARGCGDRIDRRMRSIFGFGRKSPPEKFSGGGGVVAGGGGWPEEGGCRTWERREGECVCL